MSISFKLRSHLNNNSYEEGQLLKDHLENVTRIALESNKLHGVKGLDDVIRIICMSHDFGKASSYFQDYLKGKEYSKYKNHGEISAYLAYYLLPDEWKLIGFMCVRKHHGNLEPGIELFSCNEAEISEIAKSIEKNKDEVERIYNCDLTDFFQKIKTPEFLNEPRSIYRKTVSKRMDLSSILYLQ
ncbi:MAG: CRISPR-associated endonuclease Cas3'', partial [Bacilli bacterium]|nr:CRISPR-associated endonuclease Cas3'' [Bacilli bacterium]